MKILRAAALLLVLVLTVGILPAIALAEPETTASDVPAVTQAPQQEETQQGEQPQQQQVSMVPMYVGLGLLVVGVVLGYSARKTNRKK